MIGKLLSIKARMQWRHQHSKGARISTSENPPSRSPRCNFFLNKSWRPFLSYRPQNSDRQHCFTVKIKQIKRSDMVG